MAIVELISYDYKLPSSYGKRINAKELNTSVRNLVKEIIARNPQITEQQIMLEVDAYIGNIEKSGTKLGRIRQKTLGGISQTINEAQQELKTERYLKKQRIKAGKTVSVSELPSDVARANSNMALVNTSAQDVVQNSAECVGSKSGTDGVVKATTEQVAKPKAQEEYLSTKKKKILKKQAEEANKLEKQARRGANSKPQRNARYVTTNSLMTSEARRAYEMVENNNLRYIGANRAKDSAEVFVKSAKDSADVFIKNGPTQFEKSSVVKETAKGVVEESKAATQAVVNVAETGSKPKVREVVRTVVKEVPKEKIVEKEVIKEVVKEVPKTEIKEVVKEVSKTNKWAIAGAVLAGGALTWLGSKMLNNK